MSEKKRKYNIRCNQAQIQTLHSMVSHTDYNLFQEQAQYFDFMNTKDSIDLLHDKGINKPSIEQIFYHLIPDPKPKTMCDCRYCGEWHSYVTIQHHEEHCHAKENVWVKLIEACGKVAKTIPTTENQKAAVVKLFLENVDELIDKETDQIKKNWLMFQKQACENIYETYLQV